jgi:hypothetical protein
MSEHIIKFSYITFKVFSVTFKRVWYWSRFSTPYTAHVLKLSSSEKSLNVCLLFAFSFAIFSVSIICWSISVDFSYFRHQKNLYYYHQAYYLKHLIPLMFMVEGIYQPPEPFRSGGPAGPPLAWLVEALITTSGISGSGRSCSEVCRPCLEWT